MRGGVPNTYGANRPHLYIITKAEALVKYGSPVTTFFHYSAPCLGFLPHEQEMLLWAIGGGTDEYLAEMPCVAPVTIRKRWDMVYARVAGFAPDIFGAHPESGKRGGEKKRRLLSSLEHHLEELRPHVPHGLAVDQPPLARDPLAEPVGSGGDDDSGDYQHQAVRERRVLAVKPQ